MSSIPLATVRRPRTSRRVKGLAVSIIVLVLLASAYIWGTSYSIYHPKPFDQARLTSAVRWIQASKRPLNGEITLPPRLADVSITGKAYVTDGVIFFPSWAGRETLLPDPLNDNADWLEGYCFSLSPLSTGADSSSSSDDAFILLDFQPQGTSPGQRQMFVNHCIKTHWYSINSFS
jgi:hypothetical protein